METFEQSYSNNRPFDGSHDVEVALSKNEFDNPALTSSHHTCNIHSKILLLFTFLLWSFMYLPLFYSIANLLFYLTCSFLFYSFVNLHIFMNQMSIHNLIRLCCPIAVIQINTSGALGDLIRIILSVWFSLCFWTVFVSRGEHPPQVLCIITSQLLSARTTWSHYFCSSTKSQSNSVCCISLSTGSHSMNTGNQKTLANHILKCNHAFQECVVSYVSY